MVVKKGPLGGDMTMVSVTENRLDVLKRLQARLSQQIDVCGDERSLCLLMTRLQSVMAEIDELGPAATMGPADQIALRWAQRRKRPSA